MIFELRVSLRRVLNVRDPNVIATLTAEGATHSLAPIDRTSNDPRLPVTTAALALAVGADGLLVPSAAWARYVRRSPQDRDGFPAQATGGGPGEPYHPAGRLFGPRNRQGVLRSAKLVAIVGLE
jgi:hypothetical protein